MSTLKTDTDTKETFRDKLSTIDESGKRKWIFPKKPKGKYTTARNWVNLLLLTILFSAPFIRIGGEPLILFNLIERKFIIFGKIFWPQDFYIFGLIGISFVIFIGLFTVVYGRLFCGWVCPQTIFMEGVFRKIEYWIDGDWKQQMKLKKDPWTREKIIKRVSKHFIFFAISFIIANTFLAYIIGSDALIDIITSPPADHILGLISIVIFSAVFFGVFAFFREQVCTNVCPYGRLQGVMLDRQSVIVAYDRHRGEGRAKFKKGEDRAAAAKGDCIDCGQCVNVCPTGIDIRNGTQLECVNCTACIDACDEMMVAVGLPTQLIRYTSEEQIVTRKPFRLSGRAKAYTVVLAILLGVITTLLVLRNEIQINIIRTPGMLYQTNDDNSISNLYNFKIINKSSRQMDLTIKPLEEGYTIKMVGRQPTLESQALAQGAFFLAAAPDKFDLGKSITYLGVFDGDGRMLEKVKIRITGPL
jgi:cytochrome c oxidase accessory protein FixG